MKLATDSIHFVLRKILVAQTVAESFELRFIDIDSQSLGTFCECTAIYSIKRLENSGF